MLWDLDQNEADWSYEKVVQENRNWSFRQVTHFPWSCHICLNMSVLFTVISISDGDNGEVLTVYCNYWQKYLLERFSFQHSLTRHKSSASFSSFYSCQSVYNPITMLAYNSIIHQVKILRTEQSANSHRESRLQIYKADSRQIQLATHYKILKIYFITGI